MITYTGNYKKNEKEERFVEIYPLMFMQDYIEGIDFTKLEEEEKQQIISIIKDFEIKLNPFIKKAYRKFILNKFSNKLNTKVI